MKKLSPRAVYALSFSALLVIEVLIALFVNDDFIRPYGGDILVTALLCCLIRIFIPTRLKSLPVWVFLFSIMVEVAQHFNIVDLLGLGDIAFFRVLIGSYFSVLDIVCYGIGCAAFFICEKLLTKRR